MIIDYLNQEAVANPNFKGGEGALIAKMFNDEKNRVILGRLEPGSTIGYHCHETNSEIIYFLSGEADILMDEGTEKAQAGQCHYCPKGHSHSLRNFGAEDLVFFAVVPEQ